jgi:hypothetical protein
MRRLMSSVKFLSVVGCLGLLSGCSSGGGESATAPVAAGAPALTLAAAPVLPAANPLPPPPVPGVVYNCGNVALGALTAGQVDVPPGQVCVLQGTRVEGNITLNRGSVLDARGISVIGNIQADDAASVLLADNSTLTGSVQIIRGGSVTIIGATINGNLQLDNNPGNILAQGNRVGQSIQVTNNRGIVAINNNQAVGNLQCTGNNPVPTGSGNTAAQIQNQCLNMQPSGTPGGPVNPPVPPLPPDHVPTLPVTQFPVGDNVTCLNVSLDAGPYANVTVPAGAQCELIGTILTGSLQAQGAGTVRVSGANITGNIQLDNGQQVTLSGTTVGGSVQLTGNGSLVWMQDLTALTVAGNIQVNGNVGGAALHNNRATGNLQCQGNQPPPTGSGNVAALKENQCATL